MKPARPADTSPGEEGLIDPLALAPPGYRPTRRGVRRPTLPPLRSSPMRKLLLAVAALFFMAGLVVAAEVTLVKYDKDKKEITVKDDKDKESTYKITDKTKFTLTTKDGDKEAKYEEVE